MAGRFIVRPLAEADLEDAASEKTIGDHVDHAARVGQLRHRAISHPAKDVVLAFRAARCDRDWRRAGISRPRRVLGTQSSRWNTYELVIDQLPRSENF
jgi:hypothetical protein